MRTTIPGLVWALAMLAPTACTKEPPPVSAKADATVSDAPTATDSGVDVAAVDAATDVSLAGDASAALADAASTATVYALMGEKAGVALFVDFFLEEMSWSPVLNFYLPAKGSAQLKTLKTHMTDFLAIVWGCATCSASGNPDMAAVHKAVMVSEGEWAGFTGLAYEVMNEELLLPNQIVIQAVQALEAYKPQIVDTKSLYARFGGRVKAYFVSAELVNVLLPKDPLLAKRFAGVVDKTLLINHLTDFIGGPLLGQKYIAYGGKSLAAAHAGMKISQAELDAFLALMGKAMDKYKVGAAEKAEVLALLAQAGAPLVGQ